jgi:mRNA interferase HigB
MIPKRELMRVISRRTLREFWERGHADAEQPLKAWFAEVSRATWQRMEDIKIRYPRASVIDGERVVFDIGGNKYRLVVKIWFPGQAVFVKFLGTHAEYDKLDVGEL